MKIYHGPTPGEGKSSVALGNFDGLHAGHRKVLSLCLAGASRGLVPTVLTFTYAHGGNPDGELLPLDRKIELLGELGVRQLYLFEFDTVRGLSPEEFVDGILIGVCRAEEACCGFNFTFGRGGTAGSGELTRLLAARGRKTRVAGPVLSGGAPVSSTRIRELIASGGVDEAAALLGGPFGFRSPVLHGRRLGRELGTPTVNQAVPEHSVKPRFGVYASLVRLAGETLVGVTNVGVKPTVGSDRVLAETWMPEYRGPELYGETVRVDLMKFLRPEQRFSGVSELRDQIRRDGAAAAEYFRINPAAPG